VKAGFKQVYWFRAGQRGEDAPSWINPAR